MIDMAGYRTFPLHINEIINKGLNNYRRHFSSLIAVNKKVCQHYTKRGKSKENKWCNKGLLGFGWQIKGKQIV